MSSLSSLPLSSTLGSKSSLAAAAPVADGSGNAPRPPSPPVEAILRKTRHGKGIVAAPGFSHKSVFTTPNADWVPKFAVAHGDITTYADGRWGYHEYSRWPQEFDRQSFHLACIPRVAPPNAPASKVLWRTLQPGDWKVKNCGVLGVGFLESQLEDLLADAVREAITRFHELGSSGPWRKQVAQDIQLVVSEVRNVSARPWDVLGAHTSDEHMVLVLHRAGIPVWFQRDLTTLLAVYEVVEPTTLPADFSQQPVYPRLLLAKRDMSGALNMPGEWNRAMQALVRRQLCQSQLPALLDADADGQPPAKRLREGVVFVREFSSSLGPATPVFFLQEDCASRGLGHELPTQPAGPSRITRSAPPPSPLKREAAHAQGAAVEPSGGPSSRPPPIPSRQFYASSLVAVSPAWVQALTTVGHLQQPWSSVTYYFAPPWLLDLLEVYPADKKRTRYLHHWVSICAFCRMRLFDRTIDGRPLAISEWRDALWGDYRINELGENPPEARVAREQVRHSVRENIRRLFGKANALPSYDVADRPFFGKTVITLHGVESDIETQRRIVWDAYETNWRCELLALDALVLGTAEWSQVERWHREHLVSEVWGSGTSGLDVVPEEDEAAPHFRWKEPPEIGWEECRPNLAAFVSVLARWPNAPGGLAHMDAYARILSTSVSFYVRTFVDRYGRLPVPPVSASVVLPDPDSSPDSCTTQ
ncbi:hypothetical protein C8T65DRAFT_707892 [Cerioporus squamosus]|nr:hypothetical protein C8T65DRAFT_707892 [Cerioporus squamosus]